MEYDLLAVLPALSPDEDIAACGEALLEAFERTHPRAGAVPSVHLAARTFDVAFGVEAADAYEAIEVGKLVFAEAAEAAGITPRPLIAFHVDRVNDQEPVPA